MYQFQKNIQIKGADNKPILMDVYYPEKSTKSKPVIFCHGYKGFKDWGCWHLAAQKFAESGHTFVKFNFSHNGTTPDNPLEFGDLEAFGHNNFEKELSDLQKLIDWFLEDSPFTQQLDPNHLTLIGHSRGGGICALKAGEDDRVQKLITWAGVSDFASRFPKGEKLEAWKKTGVTYIENSRTKQMMPHYIQFYENFQENKERFHIENALKKFSKPHLAVHGNSDTVVQPEEAYNYARWNPYAEVFIIEGADHVFGGKHPYESAQLPEPFRILTSKSVEFVNTSF